MCGIAGIWERTGKPVDASALELMAEVQRHRGPDGSGIHLDGDIGLANRRLSIIDTSAAGAQPMGLPERDLWLTYNGEIHNYLELRRELDALGTEFLTHTDTEVVLHAYAQWGTECFERFNGMWGLGLWDGRERRLVLSRDRFGIKPLCYSVRDGRVCFASEAKAILAAFAEERKPDRAELGRFSSGFFPDAGDSTFFANVKTVPPATTIVFSPEGKRARTYWTFDPGEESPIPDAEERFRELLRDAVHVRMRSDVPVGTCLSGGLDSSAIAALVEPPESQPMHCFSVRLDGWGLDESRYSSTAAAARPGRFVVHWVRPRPEDLLGTMQRIVWHHDAPAPLRGRVAQWFVMEEVGRHVKVVLDGQGGDELLAGYPRFVLPYLVDRLLRPPPRANGLSRELADLARLEGRSRLWFLALASIPVARRAVRLSPWGIRRAPANAFQSRERPYSSALNNALWHELRHEGLPEALHSEDALSMAFSVESRTPFLDHRLVELCFSLPYFDKIADGWTKSVLRRSLAGVVPAEILARRRKLGFSAPVDSWLRLDENWRDICDLLLDRRTLQRGIFDRRRLELALKAFRNGPGVYAAYQQERVWRRLAVELWFRDFIDADAFGA